MVGLVQYFEGKKFMWDGVEYPDKGAATAKAGEYSSSGFETKVMELDGKHLVYTRRVAAVQTASS